MLSRGKNFPISLKKIANKFPGTVPNFPVQRTRLVIGYPYTEKRLVHFSSDMNKRPLTAKQCHPQWQFNLECKLIFIQALTLITPLFVGAIAGQSFETIL